MTKPWVWFCSALIVLSAVQGWALLNSPWFALPPKPIGDGPDYENIAFNLSQGNGFAVHLSDAQWRAAYAVKLPEFDAADILSREGELTPTTARPPLLPWLIAVVYSFIPRGPTAFATVRLLLAACLAFGGALAVSTSVWLVRRMTNRVEPIVVAGLATLALAASDRTIRTYATDFLTEPLAFLLTQLFAIVMLYWLERSSAPNESARLSFQFPLGKSDALDHPARSESLELPRGSIKLLALAGVILALMIFARSLFVFWIPGIWLLIAIADRRHHSTCRQHSWLSSISMANCFVLAVLVCISPWWVRNCLVLGRFMPLGTQGPITMLGGYSNEAMAAGGDWQLAPEQSLRAELELQPKYIQSPDPVERELMVADEASARVKAWIGSNLKELPQLFLSRIITHWNPYSGRSLLWKIPMLGGLVWLILHRRQELFVLIGLPLLNTIVVMLLYTTGGRFLVPLYGVLYTLAAIGIAGWLIDWLAWRSAPSARKILTSGGNVA